MMAGRFASKGVVVTGAGHGIGRATTECFAREGAGVVLVGRHREVLDEVAARILVCMSHRSETESFRSTNQGLSLLATEPRWHVQLGHTRAGHNAAYDQDAVVQQQRYRGVEPKRTLAE